MSILGLVSVSFRNLTIEEIITEVKKLNLTHIEWGSDIHAPVLAYENADKICKLCKESGISVSYGTYFRFGKNPVEEIRDYIKTAKTLGAKILRVWCGVKGHAEYTEEELNNIYDDCKKASLIAQQEGVILATECHNWTLTDCKESAIKLLNAVNSPSFKTFWQPNQFKTFEENLDYAKAVAKNTITVHCFNWKDSEKRPLLNAINEWKAYASCFNNDTPFLLEFMPDDSLQSLRVEANTLNNIIRGR